MSVKFSVCLQEVHISERHMELWHRHVGGDVIRGAAILGHEQPRRKNDTRPPVSLSLIFTMFL